MSRSWHARVVAASVVAMLATGGVASADPSNNNSEKLRAAVSAAGILEHESALERHLGRVRRQPPGGCSGP